MIDSEMGSASSFEIDSNEMALVLEPKWLEKQKTS